MLEPDLRPLKSSILAEGLKTLCRLELSNWCEDRFGQNEVLSSTEERPMDAPWIVMNSTTAQNAWNWGVKTKIEQILEEIANHARRTELA